MKATTDCERYHTHHPDEPSGFTDRLDWAFKMSKTHNQKRCPHCGKFKMWVPKARGEDVGAT